MKAGDNCRDGQEVLSYVDSHGLDVGTLAPPLSVFLHRVRNFYHTF